MISPACSASSMLLISRGRGSGITNSSRICPGLRENKKTRSARQTASIGILGGNYLCIAAELSHFEAARQEPGPAGNILRVTKLRRRDFLSPKIRGRGQLLVRLDDEGRAAIG